MVTSKVLFTIFSLTIRDLESIDCTLIVQKYELEKHSR